MVQNRTMVLTNGSVWIVAVVVIGQVGAGDRHDEQSHAADHRDDGEHQERHRPKEILLFGT